MSHSRPHGWFSRLALGLALGSAALAGSSSAADVQSDDKQMRIEHALEAQAQGGLSGYVIEVANAVVASPESPNDAMTGERLGAQTDRDTRTDGDQIAFEHALEAQAQGGLSGYLETQYLDRD